MSKGTPSPLSFPQPHKWELHPLIWKNPHTCSWCFAIIYFPHPIQILSIFPLRCTGSLILSSMPGTLAHRSSLVDSRGLFISTPCPNITLHAAVRMIFLKPTTTHVTHLIKTFQWLFITLKIQAEILKTCLQVWTRPRCSHLSECPIGSPQAGWPPCWSASTSGTSHRCLGLSALVPPSANVRWMPPHS